MTSPSSASDVLPLDGGDMLSTLLSVVEQSPVGVLMLDAAGVVAFENEHVRETSGDVWVGREAASLPTLDEPTRSVLRALVRHRRPFQNVRATIGRPDGNRVAVLSGAPVNGSTDEAVLIVTLSDVTERLEGEASRALQHRVEGVEAALRQAALGQPDALALLETAVSRVAEALGATVGAAFLGTDSQGPEAAGMLVRCAAFPSADAPDPLGLDVSAWPTLCTGQSVALSAGEAHADALLDGFGTRHALLLPVDGAAPGVLALGRSTAFSAAERLAGARLAALFSTLWAWTDAEARFQRTLADLDDALFTFAFGADGRRVYAFVTPQVEALTGLDPDALLAGDADWTALVHDDDRDVFDRHTARLRAGEASTVDVRVDVHDRSVWLRERATPSLDAAGRLVAGGLLSDVTAQKEAEATLDRARRVAERAADARMAFLRLMSHELRTPLGAIRGFADLLVDEVALLSDAPPEIAEFAGTIGEAAARALHLVSHLLELARLETDSLGLTLQLVDVAPLARAAASRVASDLASRGIALQVDVSEPSVALADSVRLEQILAQLVGNAATFTAAGQVSVHVGAEDGEVRVRVTDTGAGMDEVFLEALFEPFVQEDTRVNRDREGAGLGLAIARRLAEAMDGRLEARSAKGEGSTFTLMLKGHEASVMRHE